MIALIVVIVFAVASDTGERRGEKESAHRG